MTAFVAAVIGVAHAWGGATVNVTGQRDALASGVYGYGPTTFALSNDGSLLVVGPQNENTVTVYTGYGEHEWVVPAPPGSVRFGASVAVATDQNGTVLVAVGDPGFSDGRGTAYLYRMDAGFSDNTDPEMVELGVGEFWSGFSSNLGTSVAVAVTNDNTIVAVGEPRITGDTDPQSRVRVFTVSHTQPIPVSDETAISYLLYTWSADSVALSGDGTALAFGSDSNTSVYRLESAGGWTLQDTLYYDGVNGSELGLHRLQSAVSLSIDGDVLAVGEPSVACENVGLVSVYEWDGTVYTLKGDPIPNSGLDAMATVSLSADGNVLAIGEVQHYDVGIGSCANSGRGSFPAAVYDWNAVSSQWALRNFHTGPGNTASAVAMSGNGGWVAVQQYGDNPDLTVHSSCCDVYTVAGEGLDGNYTFAQVDSSWVSSDRWIARSESGWSVKAPGGREILAEEVGRCPHF